MAEHRAATTEPASLKPQDEDASQNMQQPNQDSSMMAGGEHKDPTSAGIVNVQHFSSPSSAPTAKDLFSIPEVVALIAEAVYNWRRPENDDWDWRWSSELAGQILQGGSYIANAEGQAAQKTLKNLRLVNSTAYHAATGPLFRRIGVCHLLDQGLGLNDPYSKIRRVIKMDLSAADHESIGHHVCGDTRIAHHDSSHNTKSMWALGQAYLHKFIEGYQGVTKLEMHWSEGTITDLLCEIKKLKITELHLYGETPMTIWRDRSNLDAKEIQQDMKSFLGNLETLRLTFYGPYQRVPVPGPYILKGSCTGQRSEMYRRARMERQKPGAASTVLSRHQVSCLLQTRKSHLKLMPIEGPSLIDTLANNKSLSVLRLYEVELTLWAWSSVLAQMATMLPKLDYLELQKLSYVRRAWANGKPGLNKGYGCTWLGPMQTTLSRDRTAWIAFLTKLQACKQAGRAPILTLGAGWG